MYVVRAITTIEAGSHDRLQVLARLYGLTAAALLVEHDEAIPLFAVLDQADIDQIERLVQVVREGLRA
ncbi:MAG: hypothetical protein ACJ8CR_28765 [Roseiflexaceae bacterium]